MTSLTSYRIYSAKKTSNGLTEIAFELPVFTKYQELSIFQGDRDGGGDKFHDEGCKL